MMKKHVKFGLGLTCSAAQVGELTTTIHTPRIKMLSQKSLLIKTLEVMTKHR